MIRFNRFVVSRIVCNCQVPSGITNGLRITNSFNYSALRQINSSPVLKFATKCNPEPPKATEEIVYKGFLSNQIRGVKLFSLTSSILGVVAQPILYSKAATLGGAVIVALYGIVGFFTFVTPLLLHFITKKYVTQITYDSSSKKYTATTLSFFLNKKKLEFSPDDVVVPDMLGMFTSFNIKGKPVFVELSHFQDPNHYAKIMGYDKPMNFKFENVTVPDDYEQPKKN